MASQLLTLICLVWGMICLTSAQTQTGELRKYALNQEQLRTLRLMNSPELLEVAALFNERIYIELTGPFQPAVVQENVNVNFDCLPWLMNFPGGSIRWLAVFLNSDLTPRGGTGLLHPLYIYISIYLYTYIYIYIYIYYLFIYLFIFNHQLKSLYSEVVSRKQYASYWLFFS